jgi:hypothetical protein
MKKILGVLAFFTAGVFLSANYAMADLLIPGERPITTRAASGTPYWLPVLIFIIIVVVIAFNILVIIRKK